ncbi:hypothetical protein [Trichococcus shcherbakoviae]|uniref:Uncharacterized protein n=1 Tax=Trichococcus shcherbakoviae subsp. psychrophilus TaxID=2585775 RepID=A0A5C5E8F3_9LACT|nr:hypothetical protein [Trichococcus shcherbakoviae]TNV69070.1 hypothetical protein FHK04_06050 [Trichococcus shcherbakoviae subsp. psychrophilus]
MTEYEKIKKIEASVGGYFGGYYQVEVDLENNLVSWTHGGEGELEETVHRNIRLATVKKFLEQLETLDLLNWEAEYIDMSILDGTQWHIEIVMDSHTIAKHGSNCYPEQWGKFRQAISEITGKPFR